MLFGLQVKGKLALSIAVLLRKLCRRLCLGTSVRLFFCAEKPLPKYEKPNKWASIKKEEPRLPVVFTVEPLERESVGSNSKKKNAGDGFGEFLEACSRCKKKLDENKDVFVYGYLGAFCSNYCRDKQIDIDGFNGEVSKDLAARLEAADSCNKR